MNPNEVVEKPAKQNAWLWVMLAVPTLIVVAGLVTVLSTFMQSSGAGKSTEHSLNASAEIVNAIQHAKNNNYRAEISADMSNLKILVFADSTLGPESLYLELTKPGAKKASHQVRVFKAGSSNQYNGMLPPGLEYRSWMLAIYPQSDVPAWRLEGTLLFPNASTSLSAN